MPLHSFIWVLLRILLGAYLMAGFAIYVRRAPDIENKAREEAAGKNIALRAVGAVLAWPVLLIRARKKT